MTTLPLQAWLDPKDLPSQQQLTCTASGKPLNFLLQVYAPPEEEIEGAFHRTMFVFVSPEVSIIFKCLGWVGLGWAGLH